MSTPAIAVSRGPITLRLPASKQMPRKLVIRWEGTDAAVIVFGASGAPEIASAVAVHERCEIRERLLWIGQASFDLTDEELRIVESQLAQHGLRKAES